VARPKKAITEATVESIGEEIANEETIEEKKFPKEDVIRSADFSPIDRDFLSGYLEYKKYTVAEAKQALNKIKKGVVN